MGIKERGFLKCLLDAGYYCDYWGVLYRPDGFVQQVRLDVIKIKRRESRLGYFCFSYRPRTMRKVRGVYNIKVHRYIAYLKFGDKLFEEGVCVRHLNCNSVDNCWDNIGLGTFQENSLDEVSIRRKSRSVNGVRACALKHQKYAELQDEICRFYGCCKSYHKTMLRFNISSKGALWSILNNVYLK